MPRYKVIISGGGTGGHIFPAIAIANAIKRKAPETEFLFVGAEGRMEMERIPAAGFEIIGLPIMGIQRRLTLRNLLFPFKLISSLLKARKVLRKFKPDVAIGVGGYASGPLLQQATRMGIPSLIQEQNSFPGITNRILAKRVQKICVAYEDMERFFPSSKIVVTGNPVRHDIREIDKKRAAGLLHFGFEKHKRTVLVIGGSLGARTINNAISDMISYFVENEIQVIWQTGKHYFETALEDVRHTFDNAIIPFAFIEKMDLAYAVADVVVSRAGALSVSEISVTNKPAILIPSPNVAEDHQTKNAQALVDQYATILLPDHEAVEKLPQELDALLKDPNKMDQLRKKLASLAKPFADDHIAEEVLMLIEK